MNNKLKFSHLALSLLIALSACGGGSGGGGSNNNPNPPDPDAILAPLTMRIEQSTSDQGLVDWVDLRKVAGHTTFKLIVTNTNKVSIKFNAVGFLNRKNPDGKFDGPLIAKTISFIKNSNPDNCLNQASLAPNASCSYYAYGIWTPNYGFPNQSTFNGEVQYSITDSNNQRRTCYGDGSSIWGVCYGFTAGNGIPFQFKLTPLSQLQDEGTDKMANSILNWMSMDGRYGLIVNGNVVTRYDINFINGQLSFSNPIPASGSERVRFASDVVLDYNGSNVLFQEYQTGVIMGRTKYVGNVASYLQPPVNMTSGSIGWPFVIGHNGSVWIPASDPNDVAIVFDGINNAWNSTPLNYTNTTNILGIDSTGILVARDEQGNFECINPNGYSRKSLQNYDMSFANHSPNSIDQGQRGYADGNYDHGALTSYRGVFVPMYISQNNFYNADGTTSRQHVGYFKVDTTNGNCQVDANDYYIVVNLNMRITPNFLVIDALGGNFVTSTANL